MMRTTTTKLHPVCNETQFDQVLAEAQQLEEPVIFVWYGVLILFHSSGFPILGCLVAEKKCEKMKIEGKIGFMYWVVWFCLGAD
jgi:hypothetical protein